MIQTAFFPNQTTFFGGQLLEGQRKTQRPLATKLPIHLILKAERPILFKHKKLIEKAIKKYSEKFGIKVYDKSVQKDHVHTALRIQNRAQYNKFIRTLTSYLARKIAKGMWKFRPFSRVVKWGRDFNGVREYIAQNEREIPGISPYKPRKCRYKLNTS